MLSSLRPALTRVLAPVGEVLARTPVTPNAVTITGTIGVMAGALGLLATGHLLAGTIVCTVFVLLDLLDGVLARIRGTSGAWGAFLDSTLDRVADASVFAGLAIWFARGGHDGLLSGVALFCLVAGALVSYVKARAEGLGIRCDVGVAERAERMLITLVATGVAGLGVPYILAVGLWVMAAASAVTLGQRVYAVRQGIAAAAPAAGPPHAGGKGRGPSATLGPTGSAAPAGPQGAGAQQAGGRG